MALKKHEVIDILKDLVSNINHRIPITHAYLFGSYAKGHPTRWSDIDLALASPKFKGIRFMDSKMLIPYLKGYPDMIEIHPFKKEDFNVRNLFVKEIVKKGKRIK